MSIVSEKVKIQRESRAMKIAIIDLIFFIFKKVIFFYSLLPTLYDCKIRNIKCRR